MLTSWSPRQFLVRLLGVVLCLLTIIEVNHPRLSPQSQLAFFAMLGMILCFLNYPLAAGWKENRMVRTLDVLLAGLAVVCFSFIIVQTEPVCRSLWMAGRSLGNRAGQETSIDYLIGFVGLVLVLEAVRRSIGPMLGLLTLLFLAYACWGQGLPEWLFPHRGYGLDRIVSQTFLQSQGVFGVALRVMFTYVFLFVILGVFLRVTGVTQFIIDFTRQFFRASPGGPAKVAVLSSGLMGSLSGSAVANTATTGTFTIPLMQAAGFPRQVAAAIEAAASSGGALVPPVMGAGAYMMLEMISPPVTYLQVIQAALIPAILYYLSLYLIVHFYSKSLGHLNRAGSTAAQTTAAASAPVTPYRFEGIIFLGAIAGLIAFLVLGYTPFRAVSLALLILVFLSSCHRRTRLTPARILEALVNASRDVIPLICAASCVGVIIGVVTLTGIGTRLPASIIVLAEGNLGLALILIMACTIVLGMGLPSVVCYLLMATLIGPALTELNVVPLASHLFIFYFGMMSMVTPPVALAAYVAASIAGTRIMGTAVTAFRFALVGFTLPYMFVFRPELLMLSPEGGPAALASILPNVVVAALGIVCFAAAMSGYLFGPLSIAMRLGLSLAAGLFLFPGQQVFGPIVPIAVQDVLGALLFSTIAFFNWKG